MNIPFRILPSGMSFRGEVYAVDKMLHFNGLDWEIVPNYSPLYDKNEPEPQPENIHKLCSCDRCLGAEVAEPERVVWPSPEQLEINLGNVGETFGRWNLRFSCASEEKARRSLVAFRAVLQALREDHTIFVSALGEPYGVKVLIRPDGSRP